MVGLLVGVLDGFRVVGILLGIYVGTVVGPLLGSHVCPFTVGLLVGCPVGMLVGKYVSTYFEHFMRGALLIFFFVLPHPHHLLKSLVHTMCSLFSVSCRHHASVYL